MAGRPALLLLLLVVAVGAEVARGQDAQASKHEEEIAALKAQLRAKDAEISKAQQWKDEAAVKDAQIADLKDQVGRTQTATEGHLSTCQQQLRTAKTGSAKAQKELQGLEEQKDSLSSELSKVQAALSKVQSSETEAQGQLQSCKGDLKVLATRLREAENELSAAKVQVIKLQEELKSAAMPAWLRDTMSMTMDWVAPYTSMATSHPVVGNLTSEAMKYSSIAAKRLSEAYSAAKPTVEEFTVVAQEWFATSYVAAKPHIDVAVASVQKYSSDGATVMMKKVNEVMASEAVANIKLQGSVTATELKQYIGSQMAAVPALQPYATPENLDIVLYALLSLPGLVLLSLLPRCCRGTIQVKKQVHNKGGSDKDGAAKGAQSPAKGHKKSKKQKG